MAQIVAAGALSHSPLMNAPIPANDAARLERFRAAAGRLGERIRAAEPDALVVFGPDHFRTLFYDNMPAFCLGVGQVDGWGDWGTPTGPFATAPKLARHILAALYADGFDPAYSYDLRVDHGISQPLQIWDMADRPLVPIIINTSAPPLPTPIRSYQFGAAVGRAIAAWPEPLRVAVVGSGGLSHAPPMGKIESEDPAQVERLIHGRARVATEAKAREASLLATVERYQHGIQAEWDRAFLERLVQGQAEALARELDHATIEAAAGNGGQEIRTWLAMAGAVGNSPLETLGYEPITALITGMGVVAASL